MRTRAPRRYLVTGSYDALVTVWELASATAVATIPSIEYALTGVSVSCDGKRVAYSQERGPIGIAAMPTGRVEGTLKAPACRCVAFHPKHANVLAFGLDDANVWTNDGRRSDAGGAIGLAFLGVSGGGMGGGGMGGGSMRGR